MQDDLSSVKVNRNGKRVCPGSKRQRDNSPD